MKNAAAGGGETTVAGEEGGRMGCVLAVPYPVNEQKETLIFDSRAARPLVESAASGPSKKTKRR